MARSLSIFLSNLLIWSGLTRDRWPDFNILLALINFVSLGPAKAIKYGQMLRMARLQRHCETFKNLIANKPVSVHASLVAKVDPFSPLDGQHGH